MRHEYKVSAQPLYSDGTTGKMCAYDEAESLAEATSAVVSGTENWLRSPGEEDDDGRDEKLIGFDITVEMVKVPEAPCEARERLVSIIRKGGMSYGTIRALLEGFDAA